MITVMVRRKRKYLNLPLSTWSCRCALGQDLLSCNRNHHRRHHHYSHCYRHHRHDPLPHPNHPHHTAVKRHSNEIWDFKITNFTVPFLLLPELQLFFFLPGNVSQGAFLKVFHTFPDTINTPKEWFLFLKGLVFHANFLTAVNINPSTTNLILIH